jgi:predicted metal-dependent hydrolase
MTFRRRDIEFRLHAGIPIHWLGGHCHFTRFYDALSIMFPEGERSFIESVRRFRDRVHDEALALAVTEFIAQEALHTREHARYNRWLARQGVPVASLEQRVAKQQAFARRYLPASVRLAFTACLEHFTAMFADCVLRDPRALAGAHPRMAHLWRWHALEETEHKAVAFDVFTAALGGPIRRYLLRCTAMLFVTAIFSTLLWRMTFTLVRHDRRAGDVRGWLELLHMQFVRPGMFRSMIPNWLAWFSPRFHPWRHDNRALIRRYADQFRQGAEK